MPSAGAGCREHAQAVRARVGAAVRSGVSIPEDDRKLQSVRTRRSRVRRSAEGEPAQRDDGERGQREGANLHIFYNLRKKINKKEKILFTRIV